MKKHVRHIDKKLRSRLRLYVLLSLAMISIVVFNWLQHKLSLELSVLCMGGGLIIGIISSRMFHISWSHDAKQVVSQFDLIGGIVLGGYILFELSREWVFAHYLTPIAFAATFAFVAGTMIGRVLGTRGKIIQILKEQGVFDL
jgi:hypothetical protein